MSGPRLIQQFFYITNVVAMMLKAHQILHGNRGDISKSDLLKSELRRFLGQISDRNELRRLHMGHF